MTEPKRSPATAWVALIVTVALLVAAAYGAALILSGSISARIASAPAAPSLVPLDLALPAALLLIAAFLVGLSLFKLLATLHGLVAMGNTLVVIEHNLDVIKNADHVIDLGPEGGDEGGCVVATGTPEQVAANNASHTGRALRTVLKGE